MNTQILWDICKTAGFIWGHWFTKAVYWNRTRAQKVFCSSAWETKTLAVCFSSETSLPSSVWAPALLGRSALQDPPAATRGRCGRIFILFWSGSFDAAGSIPASWWASAPAGACLKPAFDTLKFLASRMRSFGCIKVDRNERINQCFIFIVSCRLCGGGGGGVMFSRLLLVVLSIKCHIRLNTTGQPLSSWVLVLDDKLALGRYVA